MSSTRAVPEQDADVVLSDQRYGFRRCLLCTDGSGRSKVLVVTLCCWIGAGADKGTTCQRGHACGEREGGRVLLQMSWPGTRGHLSRDLGWPVSSGHAGVRDKRSGQIGHAVLLGPCVTCSGSSSVPALAGVPQAWDVG